MSHGMMETDHAAYAITPAWHGLGTVVKGAMTSEEAIREARLDWNVIQVPVMYDRNRKRPEPQHPDLSRYPAHQEIEGMVANIRSDTGNSLGVVSTRYKPIQNVRAFEFLDSLVMDGVLKYESCGSLWNGQAIWLLARMPEVDRIVGDDISERYILFANWHNGKKTATTIPTHTRVVCWNTLLIALNAADWRILNISHKGDVSQKLDQARMILGLSEIGFKQYADFGRELTKIELESSDLRDYVEAVFPIEDRTTPRIERKIQAARQGVYEAFEHPTNKLAGVSGTAWAAFNAVTFFMDHQFQIRRSSTEDETKERRFWHTMDSSGSIGSVKARAEMIAKDVFLEDSSGMKELVELSTM